MGNFQKMKASLPITPSPLSRGEREIMGKDLPARHRPPEADLRQGKGNELLDRLKNDSPQ